jgi:hypothetical protein
MYCAIIKGDTIILLILRLRGIDFSLYWDKAESTLAYTEYKRNQIPLVLSISRIGFALYFYYPVPLTWYKLKLIPLILSIS